MKSMKKRIMVKAEPKTNNFGTDFLYSKLMKISISN